VWMETGPLVVPESMSAGVPVLGSALGGITRFIRHEVDGLLIPAGDVQAWAHAIRRLVEERGFLAQLTAGVRPPETMDRIVDEMVALYSRRLAA
jgi:glycosyltransferase involved in cell wall biosynthesis